MVNVLNHTEQNSVIALVDRPPKTWVRVAEQLEGLILGNKLEPGSKLPPERVLCRQLGVSRTVLREAIKNLAAHGLVEEVNGKGTFVSKPNLDAVRKSLAICLGWHAQAVLENLIELRKLIEVEIAGLASIHATPDEISELWQNVRETEAVVDGNIEEFIKLDMAFHSGLAKATHNQLFEMLLDAIAGAMVGKWGKLYPDHTVRRKGIRNHRQILEAIESRKPDQAREAVRDNIEAFKHDVVTHSE